VVPGAIAKKTDDQDESQVFYETFADFVHGSIDRADHFSYDLKKHMTEI
jgi:hypothetical protein